MKPIGDLIAEFDEVLKSSNSYNYMRLDNGLGDTEIDNYFKKFGIEDQDLKALYVWKGGWSLVNSKPHISIMEFGCFLSLDSIPAEIELNVQNSFWPSFFVPLFNDYSGSYLLHNTRSTTTDQARLCLFSPSLLFVEPVSYFDSIQSMLETVISAYRENVFVYDAKTDFLDIDFPKYRVIAKDLNKNSAYWGIEKQRFDL